MDNPFTNLEPHKVWQYFYEITQIPRPSKKEDKIIAYLENFAKTINAKTLVYKNAGHFNTNSGYTTFPDILKLL